MDQLIKFTIYHLFPDLIQKKYQLCIDHSSHYLLVPHELIPPHSSINQTIKIQGANQFMNIINYQETFSSIKKINTNLSLYDYSESSNIFQELMKKSILEDKYDFQIDHEKYKLDYEHRYVIPHAILEKKNIYFSKKFLIENAYTILGDFFHEKPNASAINHFFSYIAPKDKIKYMSIFLNAGYHLHDNILLSVLEENLPKNDDSRKFLIEYFKKDSKNINNQIHLIDRAKRIIEIFSIPKENLLFLQFIQNELKNPKINWLDEQPEYFHLFEILNLKNIEKQFANPNLSYLRIAQTISQYFQLIDHHLNTRTQIKNLDHEPFIFSLHVRSSFETPYNKNCLLEDLNHITEILLLNPHISNDEYSLKALFESIQIQKEMNIKNEKKKAPKI